jgi:hypothetical protein
MSVCTVPRITNTFNNEDLAGLPADLRTQVRKRKMSLAAARAWARLREAFGGDQEALGEVLYTALTE